MITRKSIYTSFILLFVVLTGCIANNDMIEPLHEEKIEDVQKTIVNETPVEEIEDVQKIEQEPIVNKTIPEEVEVKIPPIQNSWYKPKPGISWQWQLSGKIDTIYDVDLYDIDLVETPQSVIDELHGEDIRVICYFSAGSWEEFRDDADQFPKEVLGKVLDGWDDEKWLDVSNYEKFADIMQGRLDLAVQKNCDGVEPDNVDGFQNNNGFGLTYDDQLDYNKWLAEEAHKRNLSIALKNDLDQIEDLVDYFDFAVNEQCFEYDECDLLLPFVEQEKAVLGVEYEIRISKFCEEANLLDFSWLKMEYDLDGGRDSC